MKMTEYPAVKNFTPDNILLTDGNNGTKKIFIGDAILAALHMVSPNAHKMFFRGKNLGSSLTPTQKAHIQDGSFDDLWLGDYWESNGVKWRIADIDYWYGYGDTKFEHHHLVIVPDTILYKAQMNTTPTVTGGYIASKMYTANLEAAKTTIKSVFSGAVLTRRELLSNAAKDVPTGASWYDSSVELLDLRMITGREYDFIGQTTPTIFTLCSGQLALFSSAPNFILANDKYWTRSITNSVGYAYIHHYGNISQNEAISQNGVRPVFAIG